MAATGMPGNVNENDLLNFNMESISNELNELLIGNELGKNCSDLVNIPTQSDPSAAAVSFDDGAYGGILQEENSDLIDMQHNDVTANLLEQYRNYYYYQEIQQQQQQQRKQLQQQEYIQHRLPAFTPQRYDSIMPLPTAPSCIPQCQKEAAQPLPQVSTHINPYTCTAPLQHQPYNGGSTSSYTPYTAPTLTLPSPAAAAASSSSTPKFEFHFLRNQSYSKSSHPTTDSIPLLSSAAMGRQDRQERHFGSSGGGSSVGNGFQRGFRKFQRPHHKSYEPAGNELDYDKIVVDMAALGIPADGREPNLVIRLFTLFRRMHYYLNDKFPHGNELPYNDGTVCGNDKTHVLALKSMPRTLNLQYQVKHAGRKCSIFLMDMESQLNANKLYDLELFVECENSLITLRNLLGQLEMFKRIELEHKRYEFHTEEARAQAECLEILLDKINDQIRETNLCVHLFNWAIDKKYGRDTPATTTTVTETDLIFVQPDDRDLTLSILPKAVDTIPDSELNKFILNFGQDIGNISDHNNDDDDNDHHDNDDHKVHMDEAAAIQVKDKSENMFFTASDIELDSDRQSTRYIGYK